MLPKDKVTTPDKPIVADKVTDVAGEVASVATPTDVVADANKEVKEATDDWKAKYEEIRKKSEQDVGKVKSALQKQIDEIKKSSDEKEKSYKQQLIELRKSSMTDDERKALEVSLSQERLQELENQIKELQTSKERTEQFFYYKDMFINKYGLKSDEFNANGNFEEMYTSGMDALEAKLNKLQGSPQKRQGIQPPEVAPSSSAPATTAMTLKELADKHTGGNIDELFSRFEKRTLDPKLLNEIVAKSK